MNFNLRINYHYLLILIVLGIGIGARIALNNTVYSPDAVSFVIWAKYLTEHSLVELYQTLPGGYLPYPPLYYYTLMPLGFVMKWFQLFNYSWLSLLIVKLPVIAADVGVSILIYQFTKKYQSEREALPATAFYFLHPAIIYNTSVWGQIDSVIILFGFACVLMLTKRMSLAGLALFVIGGLTKLQMLTLAPLVGIYSLKYERIKNLIRRGWLIGILIVLSLAPVVLEKGIVWIIRYFASFPHQYPYTSVYAYNLWSPFGFIVSDKLKLFNLIELRLVGMFLFWIVAGLIVWPIYRQKQLTQTVMVYAAFLLFFDFAFFSTRIHSRYLIYSLGFLAPFFSRMRLYSLLFSILLIANFLLPNKNPLLNPVVTFLNQPVTIIFFVGWGFSLFLFSFRKYQMLLSS